jgi:hypothetical protein
LAIPSFENHIFHCGVILSLFKLIHHWYANITVNVVRENHGETGKRTAQWKIQFSNDGIANQGDGELGA